LIREVCSCGAEIETDLPEQIELVKSWRRSHKHQADKPDRKDTSALSSTEVSTVGFQPELPVFNDGDEW
jgi:transcriptional regulator of acetoin/glycerol metabolism